MKQGQLTLDCLYDCCTQECEALELQSRIQGLTELCVVLGAGHMLNQGLEDTCRKAKSINRYADLQSWSAVKHLVVPSFDRLNRLTPVPVTSGLASMKSQAAPDEFVVAMLRIFVLCILTDPRAQILGSRQ